MRKALLNDAVELSKKMKRMASEHYITVFDDEVTLLVEDFMSMFDEYEVTKVSGSDVFACKISAMYNGVKVSAYANKNEVEKYDIQI